MAKRKPDLNQLAARIVEQSTGSSVGRNVDTTKNPAAVALGRLGGLKGGKARDRALSKKRKSQIAKKAAVARWKKAKGHRR